MWKSLALGALISATAAASAAGPDRVSFISLGKARIGMTERELSQAFGGPVVHDEPETQEDGCYYVSVRGLPDGAGLMIVEGRLARIDVFDYGIPTVSGAGVGTSEQEVKRIYGGQLKDEPHAYAGPEGRYLTLRSRDGRYGMRFETDGQAVTGFYAGTTEAIQYIEGCQ